MPPASPTYQRVSIIGVGLLGASLGLALRARGLAAEVVGIGRRVSSLQTALERGAIDRFSEDVRSGVEGAELVVIATPAGVVVDLLDTLRECLPATTVVTDVTSTKAAICLHASNTWPAPRRFVGSHPMAGSERFGPEHGNSRLFQNSVCLVEDSADLDHEARVAVVALWESVGARIVSVNPELHDAVLARTSHIPHVLSTVIAMLGQEAGDVRELIGNGFRDMTRLAAGRPEIWRDICLSNRAAILAGSAEVRTLLAQFEEALESADQTALERFFEAGRAAREKVVGA